MSATKSGVRRVGMLVVAVVVSSAVLVAVGLAVFWSAVVIASRF